MSPSKRLWVQDSNQLSSSLVRFCPRDLGHLKLRRFKGLEVLQCDRCSGLWLPATTIAKALGITLRTNKAVERSLGLVCPTDGAVLQPLRSHGVEIDICPVCDGVWMDGGELQRILVRQQMIPAGSGVLDLASCVPDFALEGAFHLGKAAIEIVLEALAEMLSGLGP